ncbi:hypothetical protein CBW52_13765 [Yersinia kristensenii]|uniref:Uncharacterized protein n=1 Tax=Yersinia kristensenii TaxID=28152 RepID=A0AB73P6W5_YERKR|nr:hypothetical protein CBW52_13765 [Yersinia kristensenii]PHZ34801.1 hypothetical protein CS536_16740 [Yersinia kristensenii]PJE84163.1 hypothetical protein CU276_09535 [Yersinia kristensenii]
MNTRHTSSCRGVGCPCSPQSLSYLSSWGLTHLPPSCNSNYLGSGFFTVLAVFTALKVLC